MNEYLEKKEIKNWLVQHNDLNITNFEFIDILFDDILMFFNNNNLKIKNTEDYVKMKFIRFLFNNTDTSIM